MMDVKKNGVTVDCESCSYESSNDENSFDVSVPIDVDETGQKGMAKLHCIVTENKHTVDLVEWVDVYEQPITPSDKVQQRLSAALKFVEEQRLCGNEIICPSEVVKIVQDQYH